MQDIGIRQIGHRYTLKSQVKDFILSAEKDLYKEGKYNAPQSDLDFIGGKGGAYGIKSTAQDFPRDLATVTSEWLKLSPIGTILVYGSPQPKQRVHTWA